MPKLRHLHKYERTEIGKKGHVVYRCVILGCSHFLPSQQLIINRESLCWGVCGDIVVYTQDDYNQKLKRPMCASCRLERQKQKEVLQSVPELTMEDVN